MPDEFIQRFSNVNDRLKRIGQFWDQLLKEEDPTDLTLEIGCGHGHWLTAYAEQNPEKCCIGIDLITKRVELSKRKKEKKDLSRVHFFKADAMEFLEGMRGKVKLARTILLFPDPWPKKRHHKRRLLNEGFLDLLATRTKEAGRMYFRTDHEEYFEWSVAAIASHAAWASLPEEPWPFEHETYFQNILPNHRSIAVELI